MPIIFIFLPFLAFLLSLKDLRKPQNAIVFIAFYALFGYANHFDLKSADISRIAFVFQYYDRYFDPLNFLEPYLTGKSADIYKNVIMSIVWHFTNNPKVFCAAIALVYGSLSYAVYVKIYELWNKPYNRYFYIYILVCLANISLVHLTGMRFFTGALLFILSAFNYITSDKKWVVGIALVPFFHFSLWLAVVGFVVYIFGRKILKNKILSRLLIIVCLCFSFVNLGGISQLYLGKMEVENQAFNTKAGAYMHGDDEIQPPGIPENKTLYRQANGIFTSVFEILCRIGLTLVLLKLYNQQKELCQSSKMKYFFALCYLFSCMSILAVGINSEIKRFICISWGLTLLYIAYINGQNKSFRIQDYLGIIVFSNFYWICYLFINAPRLVDVSLWFLPTPYIILDGIGYRI